MTHHCGGPGCSSGVLLTWNAATVVQIPCKQCQMQVAEQGMLGLHIALQHQCFSPQAPMESQCFSKVVTWH